MRRRIVFVLAAVGLLLGRSVFGVTQLIQNGEFTAAIPSEFWSVSPRSSTLNAINFVNGELTMGNLSGPITDFVYQNVTIPTNAILTQYSYVWNSSSSDPQGAAALAEEVWDSTGTIELTNMFINLNGTFGNTLDTSNLTAFAGQTVQVTFEVQLAQGATNSTFNILGASVLAFTPADIPPNDFFTNSTMLNTTSNISVLGTNILATKEPGEPKIAGNNGGHSLWWNWTAPSNGVVTINTQGSSFITLLEAFTGTSVSNLTQVASSSSGANSQVKFVVTSGTTYQIAVDGKNGATGVAELNLFFVLDTKPPTITIKSPASNAKLTNSTVVVQGTASDNVAVGLVQVQLVNANGTNDFFNATGTNDWTATVTNLTPGPNTINAVAIDINGNSSPIASRTVNFVVLSPLTLTITGSGTVTPVLTNAPQAVGATFTLTAKPGTGQVFSNWMGDVTATTATLTFIMQSNMVLQANFVPNPFGPVVGVYQGLFFDTSTNGPQHQSSGFFNATVASSGAFSAKIVLAGQSFSMSGQFSAGGIASNNIVRKGLPTVSAQLQLDLGGAGITGLFSDGVFTAELNAQRAMSNAAAVAGHYTVLIPGGDTGVGQPGGDSYGTVVVGPTGALTFAGELADGTKVTQKTLLLSNGQWPFYVSLYSGNGSILGWMTFSNTVDSDIIGTVDWFKLAQAKAKFYGAGFTNSAAAEGSLFTNAAPVLNFTDGVVWLANGNLANNFTNQITLSSANRVTNQSPNALTLTITTTTGAFKGSVANPATSKAIPFTGVILQKQNFGGGFFLGTNETGRVFFGPQVP